MDLDYVFLILLPDDIYLIHVISLDGNDDHGTDPTKAALKCLTCVCQVELNWKNLTPVHSEPSMYTENYD